MSPPRNTQLSTAPPSQPPRRSRSSAKQRRQTYTFVGLFTLVALIGVLAAGNWRGWWTIGGRAEAVTVACPKQLFSSPADVTVKVYNGTTRRGLAAAVAKELRERNFVVGGINTEAHPTPINAVALVRYGALGANAARTVARQFPRTVTMIKDDRNSRTVDVVIGAKYAQMVERTKAAALIKLNPEPDGCVAPSSSGL